MCNRSDDLIVAGARIDEYNYALDKLLGILHHNHLPIIPDKFVFLQESIEFFVLIITSKEAVQDDSMAL